MNNQTNQGALRCVSVLMTLCVLVPASQSSFGDDDPVRSDAGAFVWILNDHHVSKSGAVICKHAEGLQPAERFQFLKSWVIPGPNAPGVRITVDFEHVDDGQRMRPVIVSPALQLIHLAGQLNQFDSILKDINEITVTEPADRCDQLVMLVLIALENNDVAMVEEGVDELLKLVRPDVTLLDHSRDGIVLLAEKAVQVAPSTTAIRELVLFTTLAYREDYDRPAWIRHLVAAQVKLSDPESAGRVFAGKPQWFMGSLERAFEHGNAFPFPNPFIVQGQYRNQSNYGDEFLFFQSPLQGEYAVDAMATGFGYREAHLLVGGYYAGLVHNHTQNMLGNVRQELGRANIGEQLTDTHRYGYLRTRSRVRDGVVGQRDGMWLTHERHVLHVAGGTADVLFCRYPLAGQFDFICETQSGGSIGTDGGLVYGGLHFQATGRNTRLSVWDADSQHRVNRPSPFARTAAQPVFNRVSIRSTKETSQFESNLHPIWFDGDSAQTSPWIGLRSSGTKRPVFRNLTLTGKPTIPRQVNLIAGDELRGWQSSFYDEGQLPFRNKVADGANGSAIAESEPTEGELDWQVQSGVLLGTVQKNSADAEQPGLLRYQRPLLDGESVAYEFFFGEDASIVHPTVGRMVFLLEPTGMRVRWLTTGSNDWTTLPMDNAALEPLSRRGPRSLPLKPEASNDVRIELSGGEVLVHLNEELVYQRDLEPNASTQFGLYRSNRGATAKIQNVVMKGDWPETIPEEFLANPVATVDR